MGIANRTPRFYKKRQRGDSARNTLRTGVLCVSVAQTIDEAGELAMKLKIGEGRHLLAKILNRSNRIEAVQGAFQWKMSVDTIQHLCPGVDNVESLSPIEYGDIGRHFTERLGQALAALVCNRGDFLRYFLFHSLFAHHHSL